MADHYLLGLLQKDESKTNGESDTPEPEIPPGHVMVCRIEDAALKNSKLKDIVGPLRHALNQPLPLVPVPALHEVRGRLLFEFPYARAVIDFVLGDLVGRQTIRLRPLILVREPGGGKSRFVRRLGEVLGLGVWRTDASRSDGNAFAGTDKRWYTAEPCHPFLAIAQARHANPLILIDEIEKAGTRSDYGRFWDCLLGFLEPETAARYPDPALQTTLDLSQVSYVATANSLDPIPSPLRDRFRIVEFPKPRKISACSCRPSSPRSQVSAASMPDGSLRSADGNATSSRSDGRAAPCADCGGSSRCCYAHGTKTK